MTEHPRWLVSVKGGTLTSRFSEIAVVRSDNPVGITCYGHFSDKKILISQNGGPIPMERNAFDKKYVAWPVRQQVWEELIGVAHKICDEYNAYEA